MEVYVIIGIMIVTVCAVLYNCSGAVKYHTRMHLFHMYLLIISCAIIPPMLLKGRCNGNIFWCKQVLLLGSKIFGISAKVCHLENLITDKSCVIISNHQSSLDLLGMGRIFPPRCSFLAKRILLYTGPLGFALWLAGGLFIDRSKRKESASILEKAGIEIKKNKLQVWIFPEGTRNCSGTMLPFKKGAFNLAVSTGIPIQPIVFSSYKHFYDPINCICRPGNFTIDILPPINTTTFSLNDVSELAVKTRSQMMETFLEIS